MKDQHLYIVTGSSKGIGLALVQLLLQNPVNRVIGISRTGTGFSHPAFEQIAFDLAVPESIDSIFDLIFPAEPFARIVLVNNAGSIGQIAHLGKFHAQGISELLDLNITAPAILMDGFVKKYAAAKNSQRVVVNISSGAATKAIDGWAMYSASKAAINAMTQTAQAEANLDGTGIRFFALAPGVVDTAMQETIRKAAQDSFSQIAKFRDLKENGLLSSPGQVAEKILHLLDHMDGFLEVLQDVRSF